MTTVTFRLAQLKLTVHYNVFVCTLLTAFNSYIHGALTTKTYIEHVLKTVHGSVNEEQTIFHNKYCSSLF